MILAILSILLVVNIVGFAYRRKAWSKIFLFGQLSVVMGMGIMFVLYDTTGGIQARNQKLKNEKVLEELKNNLAKDEFKADTTETSTENTGGNLVRQ
ncbi:MAG: hypothetical protein LCH37_01580 [Bacteroidetes bacterium]|nr:hypothetical protein [Bacteroidota bacterium]MCK6610110.1 hypothetical protein [Bacteroidia bacterium]